MFAAGFFLRHVLHCWPPVFPRLGFFAVSLCRCGSWRSGECWLLLIYVFAACFYDATFEAQVSPSHFPVLPFSDPHNPDCLCCVIHARRFIAVLCPALLIDSPGVASSYRPVVVTHPHVTWSERNSVSLYDNKAVVDSNFLRCRHLANSTKRNLVFDSAPLEPLSENMALSKEPVLHNVLYCCIENFVKFGHVVFAMYEPTYTQIRSSQYVATSWGRGNTWNEGMCPCSCTSNKLQTADN